MPSVEAALGSGRAVTIEETFGLMEPALGWSDLEELAADCAVPILVKGVLTAEDAALAVEHGAGGVVVSNHGGRQLDRSSATAEALPEVVDAVEGRGAVLVDGGIRRGVDVAIALALGADAVLVGRPALWGLAIGGEDGARRVLEMLRDGAGADPGALRLRLAGGVWAAPTCGGHRPPPYIRAESRTGSSRWPSAYPETNR